MEFNIEKKEHWNIKRYSEEDFKLAKKLSESLLKEAPGYITSIVLFGSAARQEKTAYEKDIDILLILNDVSIIISPEFSQAFRLIVEKTAARISPRFHINTVRLSNFWEYLRVGDPIGINMLRDGVPMHDTGVFEPAQQLLFQGRIRPTKESVWVYWARAPNTIQNAKWHMMQAAIDLYWAAIDAAHAALMRVGEIPPTPSHVADMLAEKFVNTNIMHRKYVETMRSMHKIAKMIAHREIKEIKGEAFDRYLTDVDEFIKEMKRIIEME